EAAVAASHDVLLRRARLARLTYAKGVSVWVIDEHLADAAPRLAAGRLLDGDPSRSDVAWTASTSATGTDTHTPSSPRPPARRGRVRSTKSNSRGRTCARDYLRCGACACLSASRRTCRPPAGPSCRGFRQRACAPRRRGVWPAALPR